MTPERFKRTESLYYYIIAVRISHEYLLTNGIILTLVLLTLQKIFQDQATLLWSTLDSGRLSHLLPVSPRKTTFPVGPFPALPFHRRYNLWILRYSSIFRVG